MENRERIVYFEKSRAASLAGIVRVGERRMSRVGSAITRPGSKISTWSTRNSDISALPKSDGASGFTGLVGFFSIESRAEKGEESHRLRLRDATIVLLALTPAILSVTLLSKFNLTQAIVSMGADELIESNLMAAEERHEIITSLQAERGMACLLLSSREEERKWIGALLDVAKAETDRTILEANSWTAETPQIGTRDEFVENLTDIRHQIKHREHELDCEGVMKWYSEMIAHFLKDILAKFGDTPAGKFWMGVTSYYTMLLASEYSGIQRARGAQVLSNGRFEDALSRLQFAKNAGAAESVLELSLFASPLAREIFTQHSQQHQETLRTVFDMTQNISLGEERMGKDVEKSMEWFEVTTNFIDALIKPTEKEIVDYLKKTLDSDLESSRLILGLSAAASAVVGVLCGLYGFKAWHMMRKMRDFFKSLKLKTKEVSVAQHRSDALLRQMLPRSILKELKAGRIAPPERFDCATVFFSDIVGFTSLASKSSPTEVVELLNLLYSSFDAILDLYDCYKVETIGDSYLVVSGVPKQNGERHSHEIGTMSLTVLQMIENFRIPQLPLERLSVRIGIHTGPCAAGVVGSKMPKYCLFGDTVNTASRMETSGSGNWIHVSETTMEHMTTRGAVFGTFRFKERGLIPIKGKGMMRTFWLTGKEGFPYEVITTDGMEEGVSTIIEEREEHWD